MSGEQGPKRPGRKRQTTRRLSRSGGGSGRRVLQKADFTNRRTRFQTGD